MTLLPNEANAAATIAPSSIPNASIWPFEKTNPLWQDEEN